MLLYFKIFIRHGPLSPCSEQISFCIFPAVNVECWGGTVKERILDAFKVFGILVYENVKLYIDMHKQKKQKTEYGY